MKRSRFHFGAGLAVFFFLFGFHSTGFSQIRYMVNRGETLVHISKTFGVSVESLKQANGLTKNALSLNQALLIPPQEFQVERQHPQNSLIIKAAPPIQATPAMSATPVIKALPNEKKSYDDERSYTVKKGDTLVNIAKNTGSSVEEIKRANHLQSSSLSIGQTLVLSKSKNTNEEKAAEMDEAEPIVVEPLADEGKDPQQGHSEPLGKWQTPEERGLMVRVVKTFLGVPYRLGGSNVRGIDCSAFVKRVYQIFNIDLPRTTREQLNIGKWIKRQDLEIGDLVFFKIPHNTHVGIYIGNNQFIHASSHDKEVKVDNLDTPYFSKSFFRGIRVLETESVSPMS
jgi:peptidoglycan DL-endopeptidase LytE